MEFQESEIVTLAVAIAFIGSMAFLHRVIRLPRLPILYAAILTLMGGHCFTVVEGFSAPGTLWYESFNILEHVCYALSGVLFAVGCWFLVYTARQKGAGQP